MRSTLTQFWAPNDVPIQVKPHLRDVGVEISSDLSFAVHISKMVTVSSRIEAGP